MSANLGLCKVCRKTVYSLEGWSVGPPGKTDVYHKICFKCQNEGCTWLLNLGSYKYCDGKIYCKNHEPMRGLSNKDHLSGTIDMSSKQIVSAIETQKNVYRTVNDQVRGSTCPKCSAPARGGKFCTNCGEKLFTEGMM